MNRTDTLELPRIIATSSAPLTRRRRAAWLAPVAVVLLIAVGVALAVTAGRAIAWQQQQQPVGVIVPDELADIADLDSQTEQLNGTDAGLITEPAR